ncbi:hypothetical protein [Nonomuraea sp. NPDC049607]|uniref:hypothetical protein n=1 Tax=Nonomuraea sp. NPDC049607 TaxID=3154732 RepID=UPI00344972DB
MDLSLLRVVEADFDPYGTPEELAADRPVVAGGTIDGWQQGPIPDGLVYIELSQGGVISDPTVPVEQWKPRKSVEDFEKALPAGTKMLAFPRERPVQELEVRDPGEPLLMLVPPQGLTSEDPQLVGQRSGGTALVGRGQGTAERRR